MKKLIVLVGSLLLLVFLLFLHICQGQTEVGFFTVVSSLFFGDTPEAQVIQFVRLPRAVIAVISGAALGVSGALLQTITRNSLASPTTLGINAGAYFALTVSAIVFPGKLSPIIVAFSGGLVTAILVYAIAGATQINPLRLTLSGIAVSLALSAFTAALQLLFENETTGLFFWGAGSLSQVDWNSSIYAAPKVILAVIVALWVAKALDILLLGEDVARSLGQKVQQTRLITTLTAVFLAAVAVSVVGSIGFVGLVAPHLVRLLGYRSHFLLIPGSAIWGAIILVGADIVAQTLTTNLSELPTGSITALIGAPFLIILARSSQQTSKSRSPNQFSFRSNSLDFSLIFLVLSVALCVSLFIGLSWGNLSLNLGQIINTLTGGGNALSQRVIWQLRLPRLLVGMFAGASLGVSGLLLQGVVRNSLAGPEIVGITSGAGLGALLMLVIFPEAPVEMIPLAAFGGAIAAFGTVYLFAWQNGISPTRLALVGVAMSAFCAAGINILVVFSKLRVAQALVWLSGSTYARSWEELGRLIIFPVILLPLAAIVARWLDLMALGEDLPLSLGLSLQKARGIAIAIAVALAAAAVSTVGTVSFVGLIAPHTARLLIGYHHRQLVPITALLGAILVTLADTIGRVILAPKEIPSGLVTAIIGTPYFLWLLLPQGKWTFLPSGKSWKELIFNRK